METKLELVFTNIAGRTVTISVADPKDDLTAAQVSAAMDAIIATGIVTSTGGDLAGKSEANIVTTTSTPLAI